jgi:hypothetical protein
MTTFTIDTDTDNNITAHAAQDNVVAFATEKEFTKATAEWPIARFPEVWNAIAGAPPFGDLKPVKKAGADAPTPAPNASTLRVPRAFSKKAIVRDMLLRAGGATLQQIVDATGWQKHTVRGFISTLKAQRCSNRSAVSLRSCDGAPKLAIGLLISKLVQDH